MRKKYIKPINHIINIHNSQVLCSSPGQFSITITENNKINNPNNVFSTNNNFDFREDYPQQ